MRYFFGNTTKCPSDGNGIECDSFQMNILESYGRQKFTCLSLVKLIGVDGKNYGLGRFGVWSSSSHLADSKGTFHPRQLGLRRVRRGNWKYLHFNHQDGNALKWVKWKSKVGAVRITGLSFSPRLDGHFVEDFPKTVDILLMKDGKPMNSFKRYAFSNPRNDNDVRKTGTPWITFKLNVKREGY